MNVLSSFSFGRIIKTFLPGFVIFIGFVLAVDAVIAFLYPSNTMLDWASPQPVRTTLLFMSLPLSVVLGIFCNMVNYTWLNDRLIRKPFKLAENNQKFITFEDTMREWICTRTVNCPGAEPELQQEAQNQLDLGYFLLPKLPLDRLLFLEESYWYYLEFQNNIMVATAVASLSIVFWSMVQWGEQRLASPTMIVLVVASLIALIIAVPICIHAARLNYAKHRRKLLSLLAGVVCTQAQNTCAGTDFEDTSPSPSDGEPETP